MMSAYVKFMQAQGARVVPIIVGESTDVTMKKLKGLDGVLFPGGDGDNFDLGKMVFEQIKAFNDQGHFYPAWGTCLGYENMVAYTADSGLKSWGKFNIDTKSMKLQFTKDPLATRMYKGLGPLASEFEKKALTYNSH